MEIRMEHIPLEQESIVVLRLGAPVLIPEPFIVRPNLASQGKVAILSMSEWYVLHTVQIFRTLRTISQEAPVLVIPQLFVVWAW